MPLAVHHGSEVQRRDSNRLQTTYMPRRGVVLGRAVAMLRSVETHPRFRLIRIINVYIV